jgi:hypothetical protein
MHLGLAGVGALASTDNLAAINARWSLDTLQLLRSKVELRRNTVLMLKAGAVPA